MNKILPDDPRLTAYALGELEGDERAAFESALRDDPAARAAVEEIRAMGAQLTTALATEPAPAAPVAAPLARAAIIPGRDLRKLDGGPLAWTGKLIQFPRSYYVIPTLAAACFAVMVALREPPPETAKKFYREISLVPPTEQTAPATAPADATKPVAPTESSLKPMGRSDGLSLLGQAKTAEELARRAAPSGFGPIPNPPEGGMTLRDSGTMNLAVQSGTGAVVDTSLVTVDTNAASRTFTHPQDEKFVVLAQATASPAAAKSLVRAEPKPPTGVVTYGGTITGGNAGPNTLLPQASGSLTLSAGSNLGTAVIGGQSMNMYAGIPAAPGTLPPAAVTLGLSKSEADRSLSFGTAQPRASFGYGGGTVWSGDFAERRQLPPAPSEAGNTESYGYARDNDFLGAAQNPLSTFSIDVDTASYSNVRRFLQNRQRPPRDAVRVEELVNYFPYRYAPPVGEVPFAAALEVSEAPWAPTHRLVRIGLKGREVTTASRPVANLVFLLDVSGSMSAPNRLPLVKESMRLLVGQLRPDDRVAIVTYAGNSGLALPSTPVSRSRAILDALDRLTAGGSTNGAMGIQLAYDIAKANFITGGSNRVILCTDGDFNVGVTSEGELVRLIDEKAKSGVFLTALGFGMGNLKDSTLEKLADHGNGNYGYIDTRREAQKLLVEQANGTLVTIAKDVKIQVEFNPAQVASYRLIGYENRLLKKEDFNNDKIDAGEIGAGHTVTALYEIIPVGADEKGAAPAPMDELKYAPVDNQKSRIENQKFSKELLTVKVRYKEPAGDVSKKLEFPLTDSGVKFAGASADFKFASAVAGFGMILRDSPHKGTASFGDVIAWAEAGRVEDAGGYRGEFIELAREAEKLGQ